MAAYRAYTFRKHFSGIYLIFGSVVLIFLCSFRAVDSQCVKQNSCSCKGDKGYIDLSALKGSGGSPKWVKWVRQLCYHNFVYNNFITYYFYFQLLTDHVCIHRSVAIVLDVLTDVLTDVLYIFTHKAIVCACVYSQIYSYSSVCTHKSIVLYIPTLELQCTENYL